MNRILGLLFVFALTLSCQTARKSFEVPKGRVLASSQTFARFIERLSIKTKIPKQQIEKSIISFIQDPVPNSTFGNHVALGLTDDQAKRIKSLSDDFPFMDKVRKWSMENITKVNRNITREIAQDVFQEIVVKSRGVDNPYRTVSNSASRGAIRQRQQRISPIASLSEKQQRLLNNINEVSDRTTKKIYRNNLAELQKRGKDFPSILANGQEIVESAALITRKTGLRAMGEGCEAFTKTASREVLEIKANVDIYRARLIEESAHARAGRTFSSVDADDIAKSQRLTQEEVDLLTQKAFQDVLGYTDDEARMALSRLKKKPCRLY